jgi:protein-S-isoprenylcysteine O-methyltransferase Ste14
LAQAQPSKDREAAGGPPEIPRWASTVVTVLSFPFGPGLVVVLVPYLLTRWHEGRAYPEAVRTFGIVLIVLGTGLMLASFSRFPIEASGTPFPTNPPSSRRVIVGGPYRYVRNPMYVSFAVVLIGMSLYLARPALLIYTAVLLVLLAAFVHWYEEPTLTRHFGEQYSAYRSQVGAWLPRAPHRRP